jgi:hypothetical protein
MSYLAQVTYTGNGSTTQYSITFPYIDSTHIKAFINGTQTTAFTVSSSTLTFTSAPANSAVIRIERQTPTNARIVDFTDGSVLTEGDLDKSADQNFFIAQEITDNSLSKLGLDTDDKFDADNKVIKNLANPVNAQDAVTKHYLENTWLSPTNKTALTTVNANIANINAVNSNASNINSAVSNATNINTVATNIGSVNTVATDIAKVITVANDLAEAVSEVETVADDLNETSSEIETVANSIVHVNALGNNLVNVVAVATNGANISTVAGNNANVSTVAGISGDVTAVANISNAVQSVGASSMLLSIPSVAGITSDITAVANISTAVSNVNSNSSNINAVNSNASNINTVAGNNSNISTVAGVSSDVTTVAGISSDVQAVENIASNVTTVAGMSTAINTVNSNATNVNAVGGAIANVNNVGGSIASVNSVATNLASVNSFANTYLGASGSAPTQDPDGSALDLGDLYFDTGSNQLKVYSSTGWVNAGSSVNGTSDRFKYTVSGTPTTISGNDDNSNSLTYDAGFIDVFLNGIKMVNGTDVTVTSGNSVVFASALTNGDVVDIITFGTFNIATLGNTSVTGGLSFPDSVKAKFGTGNDLEIYHDGSNSYVSDAGTGNLFVNTNGTKIALISDLSSSNGKMAEFTKDGAVELYYDNSKKFETTSTGVAVTGDLAVDTNTLFVDASENTVVIGGTDATSWNANADELVVAGASAGGMTFYNPTQSNIFFADGTSGSDVSRGRIQYVHSGDSLIFSTDATERARFSGNTFMVGKTSAGVGTNGVELKTNDESRFTQTARTVVAINRLSSDGNIVEFKKDNTTVGSIGVENGSLSVRRPSGTNGLIQTFGQPTHGIVGAIGNTSVDFYITNNSSGSNNAGLILSNSNKIVPMENASSSDNVTDLGHASARFKDLYLGGGAFIGGTGTSNKLDDYETGTFTPTFTATTTNPTLTYSNQEGSYVKIGDLVHFQIYFRVTETSAGSGSLKISGLPFTSHSGDAEYGGMQVSFLLGWSGSGGPETGQIGGNSTDVQLHRFGGNTSTVNASDIGNSTFVRATGQYISA